MRVMSFPLVMMVISGGLAAAQTSTPRVSMAKASTWTRRRRRRASRATRLMGMCRRRRTCPLQRPGRRQRMMIASLPTGAPRARCPTPPRS